VCELSLLKNVSFLLTGSAEFYKNVLVEAHGMLMDLLIIGVFIVGLNILSKKKDERKNYKEQIDDFRHWNAPEASFRIAGILKRIIALGDNRINLFQCNIKGVLLNHVSISNSECWAVNFKNSTLQDITFTKCKLKGATFDDCTASGIQFHKCFLKIGRFVNAKLSGASFKTCNLVRANFENADLRSSSFTDSDCEDTNFQNADLSNANFIGVHNLRIDKLLQAKKLKSVKLDIYLLNELAIKEPGRVIEQPDKNGVLRKRILR
jgi:BTB/POZ domain-containing protein KCTD9